MKQQVKPQASPRNGLERTSSESTRSERTFAPGIDIYETEAELLFFADLPGADPKEIDLRYEQGELTLQARVPQRQPAGRLLLGEYQEGDYYRSFRVHESIDASRIDAEYRQGVLIVHLLKQEEHKPRQVSVRIQ